MRRALAGRVAVVTGAARGIGRAVAAAFAEAGAMVYALDRRGDELSAIARDETMSAGAVRPRLVDVTVEQQVVRSFAEIEAEAGRIDVLVNNAGVIFFKPIEEVSAADWDELMAVNLRGPFLCTRAAASGLKRRRSGAIINLSSNAGIRGGVNESAYCASKFGIEGFSRALALEFRPYNVSVNTITPGHPVHTPMSETTYDAEARKIWKDPAELMPAFVHLACQDASGINDRYVLAWDLVQELRGTEARS